MRLTKIEVVEFLNKTKLPLTEKVKLANQILPSKDAYPEKAWILKFAKYPMSAEDNEYKVKVYKEADKDNREKRKMKKLQV